MMHEESHPLAGKIVTLINDPFDMGDAETAKYPFKIEDWTDRVMGVSWLDMNGNAACLQYAVRTAVKCLPPDDNCVYGKIGGFGHIIHSSELGSEV